MKSVVIALSLLFLSHAAVAVFPLNPDTPIATKPLDLTNAYGRLQIEACYLVDQQNHINTTCLDPLGRTTIPYSEWCANLLALPVPSGSTQQEKEALPAVIDCRHLRILSRCYNKALEAVPGG